MQIRDYSKIKLGFNPPNLLEIQHSSYNTFLNEGLAKIFEETFPIDSPKVFIEYVSYKIEEPKRSIELCKKAGLTYENLLKVTLRLTYKHSGEIKEQEIVITNIPAMTPQATFIINGSERVVVNQLVRAPGVYFETSFDKATGLFTYLVTIIPDRGNWIEMEVVKDGAVYVILKKKAKKILLTQLLKALGFSSNEEIIKVFSQYRTVSVKVSSLTDEDLLKGYMIKDSVIDKNSGNLIIRENEILDEEKFEILKKYNIGEIYIQRYGVDPWIENTLKLDKTNNEEEALFEIFKQMHPKERLTPEGAKNLLNVLVLDPTYNTFYPVGRHKINTKLDLNIESSTLSKEDFVGVVKHLIEIKEKKKNPDDIDSLSHRRVRRVGELIAEEVRSAFLKMAKKAREQTTIYPVEQLTLQNVINAKPIVSAIKQFFGQSQLSQFMEQVNPLASLAHKRRLSSLGPGGLNRKRAGVEVRDVHSSHYSRICPIETPEGGNIGLINNLASLGGLDEYGFIVAPYYKVGNGIVKKDRMVYLDAEEEEKFRIAQANTVIDEKGRVLQERVIARQKSESGDIVPREILKGEVDLIDITPQQVFGVSASLIPFLEHDDANRALMGCNMQRQAVPLIKAEPPRVATGMEKYVVLDNGDLVKTQEDCIITYVDANVIRTVSDIKKITGLKEKEKEYEGLEKPVFVKASLKTDTSLELISSILLPSKDKSFNEKFKDYLGESITRELFESFLKNNVEKFSYLEGSKVIKTPVDACVDVERNSDLIGKILAEEIRAKSGKKMFNIGKEITEDTLQKIANVGCKSVKVNEDNKILELSIFVSSITPVGKNIISKKLLYYKMENSPHKIFSDEEITENALMEFYKNGIEEITFYPKGSELVYHLVSLNKELLGQVLSENITAKKSKKILIGKGEILDGEKMSLLLKEGIDKVRVLKETAYPLMKFQRTNQDTCINQKPIVKMRQKIKKDEIMADGYASKDKELALGVNLTVAYLAWRGYNYQDAVIVSERLVKEDLLSSIHIREYKIEVRRTEHGAAEEIVPDPPNVPRELLRHLDEEGIVRIGAYVKPGDILVGKVTPRAEIEEEPESRLYAILFHEKAREVKNSSFKVPPGEDGTVINVEILSKEKGYELPIGVEKTVKVYVAKKRKIIVGDKVAGRHGNKGVISKIAREEDMPYLSDGTRVDVILSPLSVPSRMNIGQILEANLGIAAEKLNLRVVTPVFNGAVEEEVVNLLKESGNDGSGKEIVYDGYTGEAFAQPITVGNAYIMKLNHLAEDKLHARSVGNYTLITQQPIGGKAQFGGQRLGEMEVWALEAYGASTLLQEMLTIKSDDLEGRKTTYEQLTKGNNLLETGAPESFNVLLKELKGLALNLEILPKKKTRKEIITKENKLED